MAAVIGNRNISLGVMGGTLITAACYGGGEVFGCSPYDAVTTAYLKATYPSYWAQIRDYGFANPQLVPWINEDNDLIVSLVSVGKERWLVGDGNGYFDTLVRGNQDTTMEIKFRRYTNSSSDALCGHRDSSNLRCLWVFQAGSVLQCGYGNVYSNMPKPCEIGKTYIITTEKSDKYYYNQKCIEDGEEAQVALALNNFTNQTSTQTICKWSGGTLSKMSFTYHIIRNDVNGQDHTFVPFKRNGQMELLDIVTGTLATRVGTFTELID